MDKTFNIATYIEELSLGLDGLMAQTWLCVVLYLLSLVLMYRYSVIAFGSRHIGFHSLSTFGLLLLLPMIDGYSIANWSFLSLIVLEYVGELQLSALNKRRRPLYAFNVGLLLSLLTFIHRGFLFLLPLFLFQIRYLERRDYRHYVALVLGFLTLWWIYLLFMAPAPDELGGFLLSQWRPLCEVDLPFGHTLFSTVLLVLTALLSWGFSFIHSNSTIQRVRVIIQSRLRLSLLLTLLHLFYSGVGGGMVFYSSAMLLLLSTHFHYYSVNSRLLYWGRIILLLIVCSLLVLRYVGLFN